MVALAILLAGPADACSLQAPAELVIDETLDDAVPPEAPVLREVEILRGEGPEDLGDGMVRIDSCASSGHVALRMEPVDEPVGHRVALVDGVLPDGMRLPKQIQEGSAVGWTWHDGGTHRQERFAFTVDVVPVDEAGNEGPALTVLVEDPGRRREAGCATVPGAPVRWWRVLGRR